MFLEYIYLWKFSGPGKRVGYGYAGLYFVLLLLNSLLDISHPFCQSSVLLKEHKFVNELIYQWAQL